MATGEILSATINSDGWTSDIKVEGVGVGGTYLFGMGTNNDPSAAKIVFTVTSQGYNASGVLATKTRTIYGVPCSQDSIGAMRKVYPDDTDPDETVSGDDVIIKVALSDFIYDDDTAITVDVAAGWYTEGGNANPAASNLAVTNSSTLDYPRVVGNWAWPCFSVVTGSFVVEFLAFHGYASAGKQVALVRISATDQHSHTVSYDVTGMTVSTRADPFGKVIVYATTIVTSTLTDGDIITVRAIAYPWVGDADSLLDTGDSVNAVGSPLYTNQQYRLDKADDHGKCVVDLASGNDGTGAVYATRALAEAGNHYLTNAAALTALGVYHNANSGHNDPGGGWIGLTAGTHSVNSHAGGTPAQWVTFEPVTGVSRSSVEVRPVSNGSRLPFFCKFKGITSSSAYYWDVDNGHIWIDDCDMRPTETLAFYQFIYSAATMSTMNLVNEFDEYSTSPTYWAIVRGTTTDVRNRGPLYVSVGNKNVFFHQMISTGNPMNDGFIFAYNIMDTVDTTNQINVNNKAIAHGYAIVQNVLVRRIGEAEPIGLISGDDSTASVQNAIIMNNSVVGQRVNMGYNDVTGGPYPRTKFFLRNNIFSNINIKDDVFIADANATGGWSCGYHVGCRYNLARTSASDVWRGEFLGLNTMWGTTATPIPPVYVDDQSLDGSAGGGGDYHLQAGSPVIAFAGDFILPYDFNGDGRAAGGAIGAYAATGEAPDEETQNIPMNIGMRVRF